MFIQWFLTNKDEILMDFTSDEYTYSHNYMLLNKNSQCHLQ